MGLNLFMYVQAGIILGKVEEINMFPEQRIACYIDSMRNCLPLHTLQCSPDKRWQNISLAE